MARFGLGWWLDGRFSPALTDPGVGGGPSAFSAAKAAIVADAGDVNILIIGDSTGDGAAEWVYLFGQWLATEYPTHSVSYRLWDDPANVYAAAVAISTGSGSHTIRIWNASVSGSTPMALLGDAFAPAVIASGASVVLWNHGKNLVQLLAAGISRGTWIAAMDSVRLALPLAGHVLIKQPPNRDDDDMAAVVAEAVAIAAEYGNVAIADAYAPHIAAGKAGSLYLDNLHPSASGSAMTAAAVQELFGAAPAAATPATAPAHLSTVAASNALPSADFYSSYAGGLPAGWAQYGAVFAVETGVVDGGHAKSLKITADLAGGQIQFETFDISAFKGGKATLAVRQFVPTGSADTAGRIGLLQGGGAGGTTDILTHATLEGQGGWRWLIIAGLQVPADATYLRAYLYADSAAAGSVVYLDRAVLVAGNVPRDAA